MYTADLANCVSYGAQVLRLLPETEVIARTTAGMHAARAFRVSGDVTAPAELRWVGFDSVVEEARRTAFGMAVTPDSVQSLVGPAAVGKIAVRANRTVRARPGLLLGLIVVAFMLAFFSLAQQVRVSATTYDIGRLQVERERLDARLQELDSDVSRLGREPAVRKLALDAGLGELGEPLVLPAR